MRKIGDAVLSGLLGCFVGSTYFLIEVVWKTAHGHHDGISWTMLVLALLLGILMERMGAELPWRCPIWAQALLCGLAITAAEFIAGCILNRWLGWDVWDYSDLPGNLLGQICPQFGLLWCLVSGPVIVLLDWMRYAVRGGERPRYYTGGETLESIIVALITGGLALVGVVYSNKTAADKTQTQISTAQAVTDTKLEELTREVREHNNFAKRVPVLEEQIKVANHRIGDLEDAGRKEN